MLLCQQSCLDPSPGLKAALSRDNCAAPERPSSEVDTTDTRIKPFSWGRASAKLALAPRVGSQPSYHTTGTGEETSDVLWQRILPWCHEGGEHYSKGGWWRAFLSPKSCGSFSFLTPPRVSEMARLVQYKHWAHLQRGSSPSRSAPSQKQLDGNILTAPGWLFSHISDPWETGQFTSRFLVHIFKRNREVLQNKCPHQPQHLGWVYPPALDICHQISYCTPQTKVSWWRPVKQNTNLSTYRLYSHQRPCSSSSAWLYS